MRRDDGTAAIGGFLQGNRAVALPHPTEGREAPALPQGKQKVLHRAGFELIGQLYALGKELVAVLVDEAHPAGCHDHAGLLVPAHRIGPQRTIAAAQDHIAAGGHIVAVRTVFEDIRLEIDLAIAICVDPFLAGRNWGRVEVGIGIGDR